MSEEQAQRPQSRSKTQRKREMHARQQLGEELVRLTEPQLDQLELPEKLKDAVLLAQRIHKFGALRRQLQYVGRLMRDIDSAAIAAQLEGWKGTSREAVARLHVLERWRDQLIASDAAMEDLAAACPGCDVQRLRALVRNARREQAQGAAAASARELFQALRAAIPGFPAAETKAPRPASHAGTPASASPGGASGVGRTARNTTGTMK
jgi:ribosome-associated protein